MNIHIYIDYLTETSLFERNFQHLGRPPPISLFKPFYIYVRFFVNFLSFLFVLRFLFLTLTLLVTSSQNANKMSRFGGRPFSHYIPNVLSCRMSTQRKKIKSPYIAKNSPLPSRFPRANTAPLIVRFP